MPINPQRLVFLDGTRVKTNTTRLYGWGPTRERVAEFVPHGHWMTTTFLAALRSTGLFAPLVVDGAMNGGIFRAWVEQHLASQLRPGDIVVLDNLTSHHVKGVAEAIREVGAEVVYLPPYSPRLNPSEECFAQVKQEIRKRAQRTKAACDRLCEDAIDWVSPEQSLNYIRHAGYGEKNES